MATEFVFSREKSSYGEDGLLVFPKSGYYPRGGMKAEDLFKAAKAAGYPVTDWTFGDASHHFGLIPPESLMGVFCFLEK